MNQDIVSQVVFVAFCAIVFLLAIKDGFLADAPGNTSEIIQDIKSGLFKHRRWHLHSLIVFPAAGLAIGFKHAGASAVINGILSLFAVCFLAFTVEWLQRQKGANRSKNEQRESNKDALYTDYVGLAAIIVTLFIIY